MFILIMVIFVMIWEGSGFYQMKRMVCSEDLTFSAFSLFKMEAQETFESLWIFTSLADFFFISCVKNLIVRFFSVFLPLIMLLLFTVAKVVCPTCLFSPLSFSKVPLLKISAVH